MLLKPASKIPLQSTDSVKRNIRLELQYDGTQYHGWQIQSNLKTIQGELTKILRNITQDSIKLSGSGRTDAGTHALGQVCHFHTDSPIKTHNFQKALNSNLPPSIRVNKVEQVNSLFHSRQDAKTKRYCYRILNAQWCSPFQFPYVYHFYRKLDYDKLSRAAELVIGNKDFSAFCDADSQVKCKVRHVTSSFFVFDTQTNLLEYNVCANGFLHHMVRNFVGTFIEVGVGRLEVDQVLAILKSKNRSEAGPTAPAKGLFLVSVDY